MHVHAPGRRILHIVDVRLTCLIKYYLLTYLLTYVYACWFWPCLSPFSKFRPRLQWLNCKKVEERSAPVPFPSFRPYPSHSSSPLPCREAAPENQGVWGLGSAVSSPNGLRCKAAATNAFRRMSSSKIAHGGNIFWLLCGPPP